MADWMNAGPLDRQAARRAHRLLSLDAYAVTMTVAVALVAAMHFLGDWLGIDTAAACCAFIIYAAISAVALGNLRAHGHGRFGAANIVTTIRAALTSVLGGMVLASPQFGVGFDQGALWMLGFVVAFALVLDGVDGFVARQAGTSSRFGARFDMEIDALLILFLSLAAVWLGKAGLWVLLIGLMRYAYVGAQAVFPALRGELRHSMRRKAICVVQGVALCLMLFPVVTSPVSTLLAAAALASLTYSFAVDVIFLVSASRSHHAAA
ncbi:CDP-alcohol phosphatidyltransferase family protein [Neorhizobium sp. T25_13]|jgi:phosphatidylglycerophosphate synthase|uniref:CDP-alcohol phosphatidyltransferase family protein n=1 Tax=Neorhizobium sp. T25_13 TaxID=2093830 RepID=UPI000CF9E432|nr:CDP-alcohol phosphatidyltransferase family protein [Neorhizobium sp. T25_13]